MFNYYDIKNCYFLNSFSISSQDIFIMLQVTANCKSELKKTNNEETKLTKSAVSVSIVS